MGDWSVPGSSLSVPPFAGPDDPAFVIGDDMPAGLVTFYANLNRRIVGGIIMRTDASNYEYDVLLVATGTTIAPLRAVGAGDSVGGVAEQYRIQFVGAGARMTSAGDHVFNGAVGVGTGAGWTIDTVVQPRGIRGRVTDVAVTPDIGVETVLFTTATAIDFRAGRVYRVDWQGPLITSAANQTTMRVRVGTLVTGALRAEWNIPVASSGVVQTASGYAYIGNPGAATVTTKLVLTMAATLGISRFQTSTTSVATFEIADVGASSDYANAITI